jgi:glycosyltransferase involved in cell wall biosynthesis
VRIIVFEDLYFDTPHSFQVFLGGFLREVLVGGVECRRVAPRWPIPGRRGQTLHLVVSAMLRQLVYPFWARRRFEARAVNFIISGGLAQLLWLAPERCRVIIFCHDIFPLLADDRLGYRLDFGGSMRRWFLSNIQSPVFHRADLILVPSARTRDDLIKQVGVIRERIVVIPHSIDDTLFKEGCRKEARRKLNWPSDGSIVLAVVNTEGRKNVEGLVEAMSLLVRQMPEVRLALLGSLSEAQLRLIGRRGLREKLILMSDLTRSEVATCYQAADCLAHVSFYEGFGYPVAEAMACGCPVVCSARGAVPEIAGDCAEFVNPRDPMAIAGGIRRLLTDSARRHALTTAGLERAGAFTGEAGYLRVLQRSLELWERGSSDNTWVL